MKQISFFIPLLGTLLLSGCAGTSTEFECNATTSDTCMTMEQANEKAKKLEQSSEAKPVDELQKIQFNRLDFTNFYEDLMNNQKIPDSGVLTQKVKEQIADQLKQAGQ